MVWTRAHPLLSQEQNWTEGAIVFFWMESFYFNSNIETNNRHFYYKMASFINIFSKKMLIEKQNYLIFKNDSNKKLIFIISQHFQLHNTICKIFWHQSATNNSILSFQIHLFPYNTLCSPFWMIIIIIMAHLSILFMKWDIWRKRASQLVGAIAIALLVCIVSSIWTSESYSRTHTHWVS